MTPARVYAPHARAFHITRDGDSTGVWCSRCAIPVGAAGLSAELAGLLSICREHELARHSATISWREFRRGWMCETTDPAFLRSLTAGNTTPLRPGYLPRVRRRVRYEWLADDGSGRSGRHPHAVTVREPHSLGAWLGPERAASELLAA